MMETKTQEGVRERKLIDVTSAEDIKYWTEQFGASEEELRAAVKAVGKDVAAGACPELCVRGIA